MVKVRKKEMDGRQNRPKLIVKRISWTKYFNFNIEEIKAMLGRGDESPGEELSIPLVIYSGSFPRVSK